MITFDFFSALFISNDDFQTVLFMHSFQLKNLFNNEIAKLVPAMTKKESQQAVFLVLLINTKTPTGLNLKLFRFFFSFFFHDVIV